MVSRIDVLRPYESSERCLEDLLSLAELDVRRTARLGDARKLFDDARIRLKGITVDHAGAGETLVDVYRITARALIASGSAGSPSGNDVVAADDHIGWLTAADGDISPWAARFLFICGRVGGRDAVPSAADILGTYAFVALAIRDCLLSGRIELGDVGVSLNSLLADAALG